MAEVLQLFENIVEHGDTRVDAAAAELAGAYAHSHACQNELVARCDPPILILYTEKTKSLSH